MPIHIAMTLTDLASLFECTDCGQVFTSMDVFSKHICLKPETPRHNEQTDGNMPTRSTRDKRAASRLNLGGDKGIGAHRSLSILEEEFIYAAEFGDIPTVQRILEENTNLSVDYSDILGRTPLRLAVGNEHLEVVEFLLDRCNNSSIHEALLQAISAGHEQIAETILKHPKYRDVKKENKRFGETDYFYNQTSEDSPFSSDITPLILAAERNQFEIVQLLLLRGETITKPHHYYCNCQECSNKLQFDQLRLAKTRLNAYKGLASGAYISLSSKDPILTAFELAKELRSVAKVEKYYKTEYLSMADQLSHYVVKLLDKVRGHDELEVLLNKVGPDSEDESYELLSRLKLAIQYNEKKFVAHPSCQQRLVSIWYSDLRTLERANWFLRGIIVLCITVFYPVLAILYWFAPKTRVGHFLKSPCVKFIGQTMSFVTFLTMILISTASERPSTHKKISAFAEVHSQYRKYLNNSQGWPENFVLRTFEPEIIHLLMTTWIIGMLWQEVKQVYNDGFVEYFDSLYNYLDTAVLTLYVMSFGLRFVSMFKVRFSLSFFTKEESWRSLLAGSEEARLQMYWLIADRFYWDSWDPYNVAEASFAVANVISFTRVSYVLPANELFGPMQISLAKMITDILKFAVIFLVLFVAFMVGLHNLYWYYPASTRGMVEMSQHNITTTAEKYFGIPDITFRTVFWSMLGRGEHTSVELGDFNNYFTQNVGYWIFGAYNVAIVIVLLNMLIAMMTRSFEIIQAQADTEWKFARSKLYMEYIKDDSTLPVPFNVVPTPKCAYYAAKFVFRLFCCSKDEPPPVHHPGRIKDIEMFAQVGAAVDPPPTDWQNGGTMRNPGIQHFRERMATTNGFVRNDSDPNIFCENLTYKRMMKRIVKRYIFDTQRETDSAEGDFDELKQDISSFRYEMLNHLSVRNRESTITSQAFDKLNDKIDRLGQQQEVLLRQILRTTSVDSSLSLDIDSGGDRAKSSNQVSPESANCDCPDDDPEGATEKVLRKRSARLRRIPEESKEAKSDKAKSERVRFSRNNDGGTVTDSEFPHPLADDVPLSQMDATSENDVESPSEDMSETDTITRQLPHDMSNVEVQVTFSRAPIATEDDDDDDRL